jgi:hypothetical protein
LLALAERIYNKLEKIWKMERTERYFATFLVIVFLLSLAVIEANRLGWLPQDIGASLTTSHYYAVNISFTLLLMWEVLGLVFVIPRSMSDSVGKQFEILALILLRVSFKHITEFEEPIAWNQITEPVLHIIAHALGALLIFALVFVYYRIQKHQIIIENQAHKTEFIRTKKLISLVLLVLFAFIGGYHFSSNVLLGTSHIFFDTFYTILIFSDILIVLVSLRYTSTFHIVFRNSAFAVTTLLIRLALTAPVYIDIGLGLIAILYAIGLVFMHNRWVDHYKLKGEYIHPS